jgi:hypothetical protein
LRVKVNNSVNKNNSNKTSLISVSPPKNKKIKNFYTLLQNGGFIGDAFDKKVIRREWREKPQYYDSDESDD